MRIHKLHTSEAFVAIDLDTPEVSSGPVRWARRILHGGAKDLARSQTYTYAVMGMHRGGASAGISAEGPDRAAAVEAFVAEARGLAADGTYLPDAAKGVTEDDLAALGDVDPRSASRLGGFGARCEGLGAAVAADCTVGLDGRAVTIEGFAMSGPALAFAVAERGGRVTAVSTSAGSVTNAEGFDPTVLAEAWDSHGADLVTGLGVADRPGAVFGVGADVMFAGSKMGIVDHVVAEQLRSCTAVVACGRLPLTARALAVLRRAGVAAPADFVALAGATLAAWADPALSEADIHQGIVEDIGSRSAEFADHDDGPLLAACYAAESFLLTWQDQLPFGRPLAP